MDRKYLMTRIGNGKYKYSMKGKNGEKEEWTLEYTDNGCTYVSKFIAGILWSNGVFDGFRLFHVFCQFKV